MANKAISELPQALNVNNQDLFVLEQNGIAKKLTAETFITEQGIIDALAEALDGHGGIQSITLQSLSGRVRTYLITFTDQSATTFQVLDGSSITSIQKTSTAGLVDTYTVTMSDGTTSFFNVTNGSSIASIQNTSTSGLVDTYTITLTNGSTQSFTVTNGERGPVGPAGDYAGIVGRDSLTEAAMDDEFLVYDTSDELEKKISLAGLETSLTGKVDANDVEQTNWYSDGYWKTDVGVGNEVKTYNTSTGFVGIKIAVKQGDVFRIDIGEAGAGPRAWCFTDESNIVLSVSAAYEEINGYKQATADGYLYCAGAKNKTRTVIKLSPVNAVKQELLNDQDRQDNNLAYVESGTTASRAYSAGDLFVNEDGILCEITASVSSGGTLIKSTNYRVLSENGGLGAEVTSCKATLNGKEDVGWLTGMGFSRTDVSGSGNVNIKDYTIFLTKLIAVSGANIQSLVDAHYKVTFYLKNSNGGSFSLSGNCAGNTYNLSADSSGLVSGTYEGDVSANGTIYNGHVGGSVGSGSIFAATILVKF